MLLPKFARGYTKHRKGVVFWGPTKLWQRRDGANRNNSCLVHETFKRVESFAILVIETPRSFRNNKDFMKNP